MRLFIGLRLSEAERLVMSQELPPLTHLIDASWVDPANYHLTMAFLGDNDESTLPRLHALLVSTAACHTACSFASHALGFFGKENKAILIRTIEENPRLTALATSLRANLASDNLAFDPQPFYPHITLARKARLNNCSPLPSVASLLFSALELTLFHSTRVNGELRYLPVDSVPLVHPKEEKS